MKVPDFKEPGLSKYLTDLAKEREELLKGFLTKGTTNHSVLLQSPGGNVYEVTINDDGSITSELISGTAIGPPSMAGVGSGQGSGSGAGISNAILTQTILQNYLTGLTLSTAGASTTFSVAAGMAANSTNIDYMVLAAAISKTTAAWAVGSGNGALDTGTIAPNTWYHTHLIKRPDTGVVDVLVSLSATSPTLPSNFTIPPRRIGSMRTNASSQWIAFSQLDDEFLWNVAVLDFNVVTMTNTAVISALTVPSGIKVGALFSAEMNSGVTSRMYFSSLDVSDQAAGGTLTMLSTFNAALQAGVFNVRTDTSGQIRRRSNVTSGTITISTFGWIDARGK